MDTKYPLLFSALILLSLIGIHHDEFLLPAYGAGEYWLDDDSFKDRLVFHLNSNLVYGNSHNDFPIMVKLYNDSLVRSSLIKPDGRDIRFTASDGKTLLSYEIENIEHDAGRGNLTAWVKIPVLSGTTDTDIFMYYNSDTAVDAQSPSQVWSNGYNAVYHLNEIYNNNVVKDSGPNNHNGTARGSPLVTPVFGNAIRFGAGSDVQLPNVPDLHIGDDDFTVSAIVWVYDIPYDPVILGDQNWENSKSTGYSLTYNNGKIKATLGHDGQKKTVIQSSQFRQPSWYIIDMVVDKDKDLKLYVNDQSVRKKPLEQRLKNFPISPDNPVYLADDGTGSYKRLFSGVIDDVTFSSVARSADWIKTKYDNMMRYVQFLQNSSTQNQNIFPVITIMGDNPQITELGYDYVNSGVRAMDNEDGDITADIMSFGIVRTDIISTTLLQYELEDSDGHKVSAYRIVHIKDSIPPTFDVDGNSINYSTDIELGQTYNLGTIQNIVDKQSTTSSIIDLSNIDGTKPAVGQYSITYTVTEDAGSNLFKTITETVHVVDTTAPVITLTGDNPQSIELGVGYTELGASANDGSAVTIDISDFKDAVGSYIILYDSTDGTNAATQITRTVNVVDTTAPVITLTGDNPQSIELGVGYTELGASANDGSAVTIDISDFKDAVGSYTILYDSTDGTNAATQITRTVNVVDTTAPVITLTGDNPQSIEFGAGYNELGATTNDNSLVNIDRSAFVDAVGAYRITYDSVDAEGNVAAQVVRGVNVVDTTPPTLINASLDKGTSILFLNFSESIDHTRIDSSAMDIRIINLANGFLNNVFTLLDSEILPNAGPDNTVSYKLSEERRLLVRLVDNPELVIAINDDAIYDMRGHGINNDIFSVNAIKDTIPPELVSANLNKADGKMEMTFSESVHYGIIPDSSRFVSVKGAGNDVVKILPDDIVRNRSDPVSAVTVTVQLTNDKRLEISALDEPLTITMEKESVTDLSINYIAKDTKPLTVDRIPVIPRNTDVSYDFEDNQSMDLRLVSSDISDTKVSSVNIWNGNYSYPVFVPASVVEGSVIEFKVGSDDVNLDLEHPVRFTFLGMGGDKPHLFSYYTQIGSQYTKIDTKCTDAGFAVQFGDTKNSTCWEDDGINYIIQTNHFTSFGLGFDYPDVVQQKRGGSGGGDDIPPSISVSFDEHEYPLEIQGTKYNHTNIDTIPTIPIKTGEELNVTLRVYENSGPANVWHADMYLNHHGSRVLNDFTETAITYDRQHGFSITDPHGIIDAANVTNTIQGNKAVFDFTITPKAEILQSDILFRVWDVKRNVMYLHLPDVLKVEASKEPNDITPSSQPATTPSESLQPATTPSESLQPATTPSESLQPATTPSESLQPATTPSESLQPATPLSGASATNTWSDTQLSVLKKWSGYDAETASDGDVLSAFGIKGVKIPAYVKDMTKLILNDQVTPKEFINLLQSLKTKGMLSDVDKSGSFPVEPHNYNPESFTSPQTDESLHFELDKTESNSKSSFGDLKDKLGILRALGNNEIIQTTLAKSNAEFDALNNSDYLIDQRNAKWLRNPVGVTPFMESLMNNESALIAKAIIENDVDSRVPITDISITNAYGANIIITEKTHDYKQNDEQWWSETKADGTYIMSGSGSEEHTGLYTFEVSTIISDDEGNFIGIIKATVNFEKSRLSN